MQPLCNTVDRDILGGLTKPRSGIEYVDCDAAPGHEQGPSVSFLVTFVLVWVLG
jgi:hypothetical protein